MTDLDQSGSGFQRVRTYLGPSLGWVDELVNPTVEITTPGIYNVKPGDSMLLVDIAGPVIINLPDVVKWLQQTAYQPATGFERAITVKDLGRNAANFNIVISPFGQQAIDNVQQALILSTAGANVRLMPLIDMSGWAVEASSSGGTGSGGGDVFKAGNNTYTGTNTYTNVTIALTEAAGDNSNRVATTAFVKQQSYITGTALLPYALIASPTFTGEPRAPTPALSDDDNRIATVGSVEAAIATVAGGAPATPEYVLGSVSGPLINGRVLTNTATITWDLTTPGQAKASTAAGGGNVSAVPTPVADQLAQWVTATTIKGVTISTLGFAPIANPTFTGDPKAPTPATVDNDTSIATTAYVKANLATYQPLDGDLTALSGLFGTNTIYYRSAADIWSPVTFSGLSFSGGVLTVTAGGGNVSNSGTPTLGQLARWTDAFHVEGVDTSALGFAPIDSPLFTGDARAPTPSIGDNDSTIATTAFVKAQGYAPLDSINVGASTGLLKFMSATQIRFVPYNGDRIKIGGAWYQIPAAGINASNTSTFIDGVGGQPLVSDRFYFVYLFNNSGTLTIDFSTTNHATSSTAGNVGVEIKVGDDSRSLIGMIQMLGTSFNNGEFRRYTRSWFNRQAEPRSLRNWLSAQFSSMTAVPGPTGLVVYYLSWIGESITVAVASGFWNTAAGGSSYLALYWGGNHLSAGNHTVWAADPSSNWQNATIVDSNVSTSDNGIQNVQLYVWSSLGGINLGQTIGGFSSPFASISGAIHA